jgi:hypothetical protein
MTFYGSKSTWIGRRAGLLLGITICCTCPHIAMASSTLVGHWVRLPWMWEGAAPGSLGIPLVVWKALPEAWQEPVARLLNNIESEESRP